MHFVYVCNNALYNKSYERTLVGFAYSTYSGLIVAGIVFLTILKYNQVPNI